MLSFPNCKINLGLHITSKRQDGYHDIESVFYPVNWCDALEIIENKEQNQPPFIFSQTGHAIAGDLKHNIIYKAWELITSQKKIPALKVHLHKNIPMGAGLGGGSSDAACFINLINTQFNLGYTTEQKQELASQLGSDCAFFITSESLLATGRGNEFSKISVNLSPYYILLVNPGIHSGTKEAYDGVTPKMPQHDLRSIIENEPVKRWKDLLVNDFEASVFKKYPQIQQLKNDLYHNGALYACMSGSGSTVFGIFDQLPSLNFPASCQYYLQKPAV